MKTKTTKRGKQRRKKYIGQLPQAILAKKRKREYNQDNAINRLPEEILVKIAPFLPLKEAFTTRKLSRRWRYIWTCTNSLNFVGDEGLSGIYSSQTQTTNDEIMSNFKLDDEAEFLKSMLELVSNTLDFDKLMELERCRYIKWVNRVIKCHNEGDIELFRKYVENPVYPPLAKLKELKLTVDHRDNFMLARLIPFMKVSPYLQRLVLKVIPLYNMEEKGEFMKPKKHPLYYLKEVEILGYSGWLNEDELVIYLIENANSLDKIIINCCVFKDFPCRLPKGIETLKEEEMARLHAMHHLNGSFLQL